MCFGVPMQVVEANGLMATCEGAGRSEGVNLALIGEVPVGTHVLVYLGSAVRVLTPQEAAEIDGAIEAIGAAAEGRDFEHLIQDLVDREPELPEHLRAREDDSPERDPSRSAAQRGSDKTWEADNETPTPREPA